MLKSLLQGKPFGHPLHPALVHFPIGFFLLSLVLDVASFTGRVSQDLFRASLYAMAAGVGSGLLAALPGLADRSDIRQDHPARKTANIHMTINLTAIGLFGINLFVRAGQLNQPETTLGSLLLSLLGAGILFYSGYLGGTMVYADGVGVGRHRRQTDIPRKTLDVSIFERRDGWVPVCSADALKDGETLRVDWNGTVIAIAKQAGEVYAFQEFCTHRYGPLSEGKLQDHQVICPWHRSCFDMRTGKVVDGPAKVNLKTYSAKLQGGKIFVK